jgi:hypothetical protein
MDMDLDTAVLTMAASIPRAQSFTISIVLIQGVLLDELDFSLTDGGELGSSRRAHCFKIMGVLLTNAQGAWFHRKRRVPSELQPVIFLEFGTIKRT